MGIKSEFELEAPNGLIPEFIEPARKTEIFAVLNSLAEELNKDPIRDLNELLNVAEQREVITSDEAGLYYLYTFAGILRQLHPEPPSQ